MRLRTFSVAGVRSWVIPEFQKYTVFYLATKTEVQILAVVHGARDLSAVVERHLKQASGNRPWP
jgi:plasmid stabilization system protein ParE